MLKRWQWLWHRRQHGRLRPEDRSSNPVIGNIYWAIKYCKLLVEKRQIEQKKPEMAHVI